MPGLYRELERKLRPWPIPCLLLGPATDWRQMIAQRSLELLERYRRGEPVPDGCPLKKALEGVQSWQE